MSSIDWPIYYGEELELGNPVACTAVCTLWTPRVQVARSLNPGSFAVIGNLYSRDGLNPMIRNILANPAIRYIVLCGRSLSDSGDALVSFFQNGIDANWRVIENGAFIDRDIPLSSIQRLRDSVTLVDLRGIASSEGIKHAIASLEPLPPFGNPEAFPITEPKAEIYPSERIGFVLRGSTVAETWAKLVYYVMTFGQIVPTDYGLRQKEMLDVVAEVESENLHKPHLPRWFPPSHQEISGYIAAFMSPDREIGVSYGYGDRLFRYWGEDQVSNLISDLKRFRFSRRAVSSLWDPQHDSKSVDPPCINLIQATIRDGSIFLTCYVRSHDVFRAWHYNAFALRTLQEKIGSEFKDVRLGTLVIISHSAHIYEDCWSQALEVVKKIRKKAVSPGHFEPDPRGSFVIRLEEDSISVYHYSPQGDRLQRFRGKRARELGREIAPFIGLSSHALYLGRELHRAEEALKRGTSYRQDSI